ncbi:MAG TPA: hypothetical protein VFZ99_07385, partial [Terriglobales bacterium]
AGKHGARAELLGQTSPEKLVIQREGRTLVTASVSELKKVWEGALQNALHSETPEHLVPEILQKS